MLPRFEYFPTLQSGSFYELRDSPLYRDKICQQISLFCSVTGRFFRHAAMPLDLERIVIGWGGDAGGSVTSFASQATQILREVDQRSCASAACRILNPVLEIINEGLLRVSGVAQNVGLTIWAGWGVCSEFHDSVGMRIIDHEGRLIAEERVPFPYECIAPGGAFHFDQVFTIKQLSLTRGRYLVELDIVRDGVTWYSPEGPRMTREILVDFQAVPIELEYSQADWREKGVALTFDGGSRSTCCSELLAVLREAQVTCTLFLTGEYMKRFPELVREMVRDGHEIANHTLTHPRLCFHRDPQPCPGVTRDFLTHELLQTAQLFTQITGAQLAPLWRAPFGHRNSLINLWAYQAGYQHIFWDFDSRDWRIGIGQTDQLRAEEAGERALRFIRGESGGRGNIMLFHLASASLADPFYPWIGKIIAECQSQGFSLMKVSQLISRV